MQGETPNIHLVHSVWRRLKKAKIRDLQPIKDVKGGGAVRGNPHPPQGAQAPRETEAAVRKLASVAAGIALALQESSLRHACEKSALNPQSQS